MAIASSVTKPLVTHPNHHCRESTAGAVLALAAVPALARRKSERANLQLPWAVPGADLTASTTGTPSLSLDAASGSWSSGAREP